MKLVVFDLDTALCQSSTMEGYALCQAVADLTQKPVSTRMPDPVHPFNVAVAGLLGRVPSAQETQYLRSRFRLHLKRQTLFQQRTIQANGSMVDAMHDLMRRRDTVVGLVSSSCSQVLSLKARNLGMVVDAMPCATKDDGESLDMVLETVKRRALRSFGVAFRSMQLVAAPAWQSPAVGAQMHWVSPEAFLRSLEVASA
ncbi:MAG: hypothetical protein ACX931_06425 [Saccharospirillum sp.]